MLLLDTHSERTPKKWVGTGQMNETVGRWGRLRRQNHTLFTEVFVSPRLYVGTQTLGTYRASLTRKGISRQTTENFTLMVVQTYHPKRMDFLYKKDWGGIREERDLNWDLCLYGYLRVLVFFCTMIRFPVDRPCIFFRLWNKGRGFPGVHLNTSTSASSQTPPRQRLSQIDRTYTFFYPFPTASNSLFSDS